MDARLIARYLVEHHARLHPYRPPSAVQAELAQLLGQRWTPVTKRTALRASLEHPGEPIAQSVGRLEEAFAQVLHAIDERIIALIDAEAALRHARALLQSIVGVAPPEQCDARQLALACALLQRRCPGRLQWPGPARQRLGPQQGDAYACPSAVIRALRHMMFLAAMSASRTATFKAVYQALRQRDLKTTEALVVLARKLLRITFAGCAPLEGLRAAAPSLPAQAWTA